MKDCCFVKAVKMGKRIGVDLGGTHLRVGIVENGKVLKYIKKSTPKTKDGLLDELTKSISECMSDDVEGIGISSPGPLKDGVLHNTPNLPFKVFNLKKFVQDKFKKRVEVENDVHCIAIAELNAGVKKKNFLVMALGTGIGGGIVIDGKLYEGQGYAGEMGHIVVDGGEFLETIWQRSLKERKKLFGEKFLIKDLYASKNPKAREFLSELFICLGQAVGSYINVFDPEVFVLMGGPRDSGERFVKSIVKEAKKYVIIPKMPKVQWSKIPHPGILGASLLLDR